MLSDKMFEPLVVLGVLDVSRCRQELKKLKKFKKLKKKDYPVILYDSIPKSDRAVDHASQYAPPDKSRCDAAKTYGPEDNGGAHWCRCHNGRQEGDSLCYQHRKRAERVSLVLWDDAPPHPHDRGAK